LPLVSSFETDDVQRLLHDLREPLAAFSVRLALVEREPQTPAAQHDIKAMRVAMEHAIDVLRRLDYALSERHKHSPSTPSSSPLPGSKR